MRLFLDNSLSAKSVKREYVYKVYDKRIEAYREFYTELVRYKRNFTDYTFVVSVDGIQPFDYKAECERILEFFQEHEVYFSDELISVIRVMLYNNLNNKNYQLSNSVGSFFVPQNINDMVRENMIV